MNKIEVRAFLVKTVADQIRQSVDGVDPNTSFVDLGLDSGRLLEMATAIESKLDVEIPFGVVFRHPTINKMIDFVQAQVEEQSRSEKVEVEL